MTDYLSLPDDLPVPQNDGAAEHLAGIPLPAVALPSTGGEPVRLDLLGPGRTVVYLYPMTGRPGVALPDGWDEIPGARGCTPESCGFRDRLSELREAGADRVFGLSVQDTDYQSEVHDRLGLGFELLSDHDRELTDALGLPTFEVDGERLLKRLTMVIRDGAIEHVFYPIFPPTTHAAEVVDWLRDHG